MSVSEPLLNLLFVGDVVGRGGRQAVRTMIPYLKRKYDCTFSIVNAENSANGAGITKSCIEDMNNVDVFTSGDHTWDQKVLETEIRGIKNLIRPANVSPMQPGKGWDVFRNPAGGEIAVISLMGKVFMRDSTYCPFETAEKILSQIPAACKCIVVDFHAEATSEKAALARFLDGKVTAVFGTHTHVQTADAGILPKGTARITDVGMVGAEDSILGRKTEDVIRKFCSGMPCRLNVVEEGIRLDAVVLTYEYRTGKAVKLTPISEMFNPNQEYIDL